MVCDDAHWADLASLRWLSYLARRIDDLPVALPLSTRIGDEGQPIARFKTEEPSRVLELAALSERAGARILASLLGREPEAAFSRAA